MEKLDSLFIVHFSPSMRLKFDYRRRKVLSTMCQNFIQRLWRINQYNTTFDKRQPLSVQAASFTITVGSIIVIFFGHSSTSWEELVPPALAPRTSTAMSARLIEAICTCPAPRGGLELMTCIQWSCFPGWCVVHPIPVWSLDIVGPPSRDPAPCR
ncbi:MAG: hypothetical protein ACYCYK_06360 [Candidatus Dormibacteria bacterium]